MSSVITEGVAAIVLSAIAIALVYLTYLKPQRDGWKAGRMK